MTAMGVERLTVMNPMGYPPRVSPKSMAPRTEFWDYQLVQNYVYPRAKFGEEPLRINAEGR